QNQIADRYVMGQLADEERRQFEEHFVDCPECMQKLETVESLRAALKELPPEERRGTPVFGKRLSVGLFPALRDRPQLALLVAACLLVAILPSAYFFVELQRARQDARQARIESEQSRQREAELRHDLDGERAARSGALGALPTVT